MAILRLVYISQYYSAKDVTWSAFNAALTTCILVNLHLVITCFSFIKPFHDAIYSGLLTTSVQKKSQQGSSLGTQNNFHYALDLFSLNRKSKTQTSTERDVELQRLTPGMAGPERLGTQTSASMLQNYEINSTEKVNGFEKQDSTGDDMLIHRTTTMDIFRDHQPSNKQNP